MTEMRNLPYLPALRSVEIYNQEAKDIMTKNFLYLTLESTLMDAFYVVHHLGHMKISVGVVRSEQCKFLIHSVSTSSLRKYLFKVFREK
jgi:hypothetical protein